jgi:hypothetical protein
VLCRQEASAVSLVEGVDEGRQWLAGRNWGRLSVCFMEPTFLASRVFSFREASKSTPELGLGDNLGIMLVNVNATPLRCVIRKERRKSMVLSELQC